MKKHYLKARSSYIVVILRSLRHGACVCCGEPIESLDESVEHWDRNLAESGYFVPKRILNERQLCLFGEMR